MSEFICGLTDYANLQVGANMVDIILTWLTLHPVFASIIACLVGFFTDMVWAVWANSVGEKRPIKAANFSVLIYLFGMCYTLFIIDKNLIPILGYVVGGWLGTFLTIRYNKNNEKQ